MAADKLYIQSPLLYRLTDDNVEQQHEIDPHKYIDASILQEDIRYNLENLLNTRLVFFNDESLYPQINESILNYGISDFSQQYYTIRNHQYELCQAIEKTITIFESRLQNIRVTLLDNDDDKQRNLIIRISGDINIKPHSKRAVFASNVDVIRYQFSFDEEVQ